MKQLPLLGGFAIAVVASVVLVPLGVLAEEVQVTVSSVNALEPVSTSASNLLAQEPAQAQVAQITGIQLKPTQKGLEVILETAGSFDEVLTSSAENSLITDIPNAQLRLPKGGAFRQDNPTQDIAAVEVTTLDAKTLRVTVTGKAGVPTAEVSQSPQALILSVTAPPAPAPPATPAQPTPTPEVPAPAPEQQTPPPVAPTLEPQAEEAPLELTVTAEEEADGYFVPDASTATGTDTPILETPFSVQVVPQEVIRDQQATEIQEALSNVSGVIFGGNVTSRGEEFNIRGFDNVPILRDGFRRYGSFETFPEVANLEQIEVLKGPASILYGEIQPGGLINLVSKKPLAEPFYEAELQVGNWGFVRPRFDISGPLTSDGSLLYRLNGLYRRGESFRGFDQEDQRFFIAPVLAWKISPSTDLTVSLEYTDDKRPADIGLPVVGDQVVDVPRDRITNEPDDKIESEYLNIGYDLEHRFNNSWKLRNAFRYSSYDYDYNVLAYDLGDYDEEAGILNRFFASQDGQDKNYALQTSLIGEFATGSIAHTLLFGVDLSRNDERIVSAVGDTSPLDIFNPVYRQFPKPDEDTIPSFGGDRTETDRLGIYLQDQISLLENLKLLAGLRYDTAEQKTVNIPGTSILSGEQTRNYDALTPRVGILYQPVEELSLYASYSQSFNPNTETTASGDPLEPEKGEGYEVGVKAELLESKLFATLAYFDITKQNVAVTNPNNPLFSIATGERQSRGVELDMTGEILPGWNIIAAYAYIDAEVIADTNPDIVGNRLFNVPKHSASLWTTYEIQSGNLQGLGFGVGFDYVGKREGDLDNSFQVDSYFLTNAAIFYHRDNWRFALNLKNLFDRNYIKSVENVRSSGNLPGEPFTVLGSFSIEF